MKKQPRADHQGVHRQVYLKNRKRILHTQELCAICGRYVDKSLKAPDPMSATVDHIRPIAKGGHPSDLSNLQLTHWICNRLKSDKVFEDILPVRQATQQANNKIYQSRDWKNLK